DDDGLAERALHPLDEHARQRVGRPARREGHDDGDGTRGIGLRLRAPHQRCSDCDCSKELAHVTPPAATEAAREYADESDLRETKKRNWSLERACLPTAPALCVSPRRFRHIPQDGA